MTSKPAGPATGPISAPVAEGIRQHFQRLVEVRGYQPDPAQAQLIAQLGEWLEAFLAGRRGWLRRLPAGIYLWGEVGRGKSFVMDAFFAAAPLAQKRRVHFHAFLHEVQQRLLAHAGEPDPLAQVARAIAAQTRLLCFDEFHVHDIGDAMLLGRLLAVLVEEGVGLVCTSNYPPEGLCPNPLYRDRFKPAIRLIEQRFEVLSLCGGEDYRQRAEGEAWGRYHWPVPADAPRRIAADLALEPAHSRHEVCLEVNRHPLRLRAHDARSAWLEFDELFVAPRSAADYLWLLERFECLAISGVTALAAQPPSVSQRFLNFVDIAYDRRQPLLLYAQVPLEQLTGSGEALDFPRTLSRLRQLQQVVG